MMAMNTAKIGVLTYCGLTASYLMYNGSTWEKITMQKPNSFEVLSSKNLYPNNPSTRYHRHEIICSQEVEKYIRCEINDPNNVVTCYSTYAAIKMEITEETLAVIAMKFNCA